MFYKNKQLFEHPNYKLLKRKSSVVWVLKSYQCLGLIKMLRTIFFCRIRQLYCVLCTKQFGFGSVLFQCYLNYWISLNGGLEYNIIGILLHCMYFLFAFGLNKYLYRVRGYEHCCAQNMGTRKHGRHEDMCCKVQYAMLSKGCLTLS